MDWVTKLDRAFDKVGAAPGLRKVQEARYARHFAENTAENLFHGVFDSFAAAEASAPRARPVGYDNPGSADLAYATVASEWDYPAIFWLATALAEGHGTVFDLGGHVGVKYYAFRRFLGQRPELRWTVCDVPAVVARGTDLARFRDPDHRLAFTTRCTDASDHDVLFASGSLQYLPQTLGEMLRSLRRLPRWIVINTTPIHEAKSVFTLNRIGTAICPYRVQARAPFIEAVRALGYD